MWLMHIAITYTPQITECVLCTDKTDSLAASVEGRTCLHWPNCLSLLFLLLCFVFAEKEQEKNNNFYLFVLLCFVVIFGNE
jgi:hypothetical protein